MSDAPDTSVTSRVAPTDRLPFLKALAHIAAADDAVALDEKQMVMTYAEAWDLGESRKGEVRDILRSGTSLSVDALVGQFSESGTRLLLVQELLRLAHADGTYAETEQAEVARIAEHIGLAEKQLRDLEEWMKRGRAWERADDEEVGTEVEVLKERLGGDDEHEHDLSDIDTRGADLSDLEHGDDSETGADA